MTHPEFLRVELNARLETMHKIAAQARVDKQMKDQRLPVFRPLAKQILTIFKHDKARDVKLLRFSNHHSLNTCSRIFGG